MELNKLKNKLEKRGLTCEFITLVYNNKEIAGIRVDHNYNGLYPSKIALEQCNIAICEAYKNGFHAEQRGYYTATYIYNRREAAI